MDQLQCNADFADYLVACGACQEALATEMVELARRSWTPLGMILINSGKLRMKAIAQILSAQADNPQSLFGDVAVELELCTEVDIQEAMVTQASTCPHVLDLALQSADVDQGKLMLAVKSYVRQTERIIDRLKDAVLEPTPI